LGLGGVGFIRATSSIPRCCTGGGFGDMKGIQDAGLAGGCAVGVERRALWWLSGGVPLGHFSGGGVGERDVLSVCGRLSGFVLDM